MVDEALKVTLMDENRNTNEFEMSDGLETKMGCEQREKVGREGDRKERKQRRRECS